MRTYIRSSEFQSSSELMTTENCLPLTAEVTVDLVFATFTPLGVALRNTKVHSTSLIRSSLSMKNM